MTTIIFGGGSSFGGGVQSNSPGSPTIQATAGSVTTVTGTINQPINNVSTFSSVQYGISPYTYSISSGTLPTGVTLDSNTGIISGIPTATQSSSSVTVSVTDSLGVTASTTSTVAFTVGSAIVATANSVAPVTGYTNQAISTVTPFSSVTGGTQPYWYFVSSGTLPDRVTLDPTTGQISGTPTQTYATSNVTISVRDAGGIVASTTSTISFTVILALVAMPGGTSTVFGYQSTAITSFSAFGSVSGGTAPYTYYVSSSTQPPTGIAINSSTGLVSGTPTATQSSSNVTFSVKDSTNLVASTTVTVGFTVNTAFTASAGATSSVSVTQNTAITSFNPFSSVSGGYTPYVYSVSSGTLPTGVTINSSTGLVSGTPTVIQSLSNVTFIVKDANNLTASTTVTVGFTVNAPSYTINYLVVGGGGAGGGNGGGYASNGGGGAGRMVPGSTTVSSGSSYTITVGAGGTALVCQPGPQGASGNPSFITGGALSVTAIGGGGGGTNKTVPSLSNTPGAPGGSGGGGSGTGPAQTPTQSSSGTGSGCGLGNPGGYGGAYSPVTYGTAGGGGGGGAGGGGTPGNSNAPPATPTGSGGGNGGAGALWPYTGITYAGGGGGGAGQGQPVPTAHGPGGTGGPGGGGSVIAVPGQSTAGTNGLGGGGAGYGTGACKATPGGGGTVILVVPNAAYPGVSAPGATVTTPPNAPGATVLTYTTPVSTTPATFTYTA